MNVRALVHHLRGRRRGLIALIPVVVVAVVVLLAFSALVAHAFGDLEVTFTTPPPATINAGESYSFVVRVRNAAGSGPPAEAVVFQYRPPPDVAVTSIASSLGPCEAGTKNDPSDPATCALGNMDPGDSATINITVKVDETVLPGTMLDNDVRAWQFGTEDDPPDNENHAFVQVILGPADLRLTKISEPHSTVRAGETFTYTIWVDNLGPSVARNVVISDTLLNSKDVTIQSCAFSVSQGGGTITQFTCTTGQVVSTQFGTDVGTFATDFLDPLSPGSQGRLRASFRLVANYDLDVMNTTRVVADNFDPNMENNFATDPIHVTAVSNLALAKTATGEVQVTGEQGLVFNITTPGTAFPQGPNYTTSAVQVTAGRRISYTLTITNNGPSPAENVVLTDRLPPWVQIYPGSLTASAGVNCETGTPGEPLDRMTCGIGTIPPGGTKTISFQVVVDSSVLPGTVLENDAYTYSDIFDPDNGDNYAHTLTTVNTWADMSISKSAVGDNVIGYDATLRRFIYRDLPNQVTAGRELRYEITVQNNGASDAQNVQVLDVLPDLFPGSPHYGVTFLRAVGASCRPDDEHALWAVIWPNATATGQAIFCDLGTMPAGSRRTFDVYVLVDPSVPQGTVIDNGALVLFGPSSPPTQPPALFPGFPHIPPTLPYTNDPFTDNNFVVQETTVNAVADVWITKVDVPAEARLDKLFEPDQAIAGNEHRYLITFGNDGPSVARSVNVTDTLDFKQAGILGETFVRCEPVDPDDLVTCTFAAPNTVNVTQLQVGNETILPGDLNPGDSFSFYLITKVDPGYVLDADNTGTEPGLIAEDTAFITTTTTDYRTANNQDTEQTEIIAEADLEVSKTDTPDPGLPDQYLTYDPVSNHFVFTYTITARNNGPSDAATVMLTDTLPADAEFLRWTIPGNMTCNFRDDGTVFCLMGEDLNNLGNAEPGRMNVGTEISFTITVRVDADSAPRQLVNRVEVGAVAPEYADVYFPTIPTVLGDFIPTIPHYLPGRRPTPDPNRANNVYVETTTVLEAGIRIDKKAVVGRDLTAEGLSPAQIDEVCRTQGVDDFLTLPPARVTYCYFVYNEGNTWLTNVEVTDAHNAEIVETSAGPFVNVIGRAGTGSQFNLMHALWASIENNQNSEVAPLAPEGVVHPDGYTYLLAVRFVILDFANGGTEKYGTNTATVRADPCTKYSTLLPGVGAVSDTDLLHDTLAVPVLENTTKSWRIYEDLDLDGLPSPGDVIEYVVDIPNTGIIEATGVRFYDGLYNYIANDPNDPRVPALLINGSVTAAIHVSGRDPITGRAIEKDLQPPDLAFGQDILLRTYAPGIDLTYRSAIVLASEILKGNTPGDDEIHVMTRLPIPPKGWLLRFDGVTYDPPIPVTLSLRITYKVRIKETVPVDTIVLNHGWVWYNEIDLFDQRFPQFNPTNPNQYFNSNRAANYHAGTPGRAWETIEFPGWPEIPVGVEPTDYPGPRFDLYARPGAVIRDEDDPTWFKVEREAPSIGGDSRIQLPVLNRLGDGRTEQTLIEIQNVGRADTVVIMFLWDDYSAGCAAQSPGPKKAECSGLLKPGTSWQWQLLHLPSWARSGIAYSVQTGPLPAGFTRPNDSWPQPYPGETIDEYMCAAAQDAIERNPYDPWDDHPYYAWRSWEEFWELHFQGQPIAIEVDRIGLSVATGAHLSGAYEGFSRDMEGVENPADGGYGYYSPIVYAGFEGLTTWLYIQNSGDRCASVDLWLYAMDNCNRPRVCEIELLSPGETYPLDVLGECGVGPGFVGSAYVRSAEPLGIVVDHVGDEVLLTHRAVPAELDFTWDEPLPWYTAGSQVNYGPLVYREYLGWDSKVFVQNLSSIVAAKVKVYFLDNSGDIITTLVDWICPRGTQEFFLPLVNNLPGNYVGAVRVESQDWWSPGDPPVPFPNIMSVAQLIRYEGPAKAEVLEGIAYNLFGEDEAFDWQTGEIETWGVRRIALPSLRKENKNLITDIAIQNVVPKPGFTDFVVFIYDQNGLVGSVCEKLNEKQVEYIQLDTWGYIAPAFRGSAVISATYWNHEALDSNRQIRKLVGLAAVRVERSISVTGMDIPGDESLGTQGFPIHRPFGFMPRVDQPLCQP